MIDVENKEIKKDEVKQKIGVIGIPHTGLFYWQTVMALLGLSYPANTIIKYHLIGSCLIYDARDKIFEFAEKENADWVFFMDSDMVIPNDILIKLDKHNVPMISGMAFKRTPPYQPCFYTKVEIKEDTHKPYCESPIQFPDKGILECQGLGMACCFIRKEVWKNTAHKVTEKCERTWFFPYPGVGEDLSFCLRARKAKHKMYVDLSINVGHISTVPITKEYFEIARDEHIKNNPKEMLYKEDL